MKCESALCKRQALLKMGDFWLCGRHAESIDHYYAKRLRKIRRSLAMTQREFGISLGVSASTIGNWESGRNFPRRDSCAKLSKHYGIYTLLMQ